MKNIVKTVSLLTIISVIPAAWAATNQRVGVNNMTSRIPSVAGYIKAVNSNVAYTTTATTTAAYYGVADCVEKYEECLRSEDVCGVDFQECTTNVLFHAQMPKCSSVLYQCTAAGVQQLFGTSAINALSTVYSYVKDDRGNVTTEVERYTYPTETSELNNLIAGAREGNKLTREQCVRRYTNCLKREDICGENFELCTTQKQFKKQAMLCDSTLERCPVDAKQELFGSSTAAAALKPDGESRLKQLIEDGAAYAALNAVKTCQKVTDTCLYNACTKNPWRCVEGIKMGTIYTADFVTGGDELSGIASATQSIGGTDYVDNYLESQTGSNIRKMLKAQCLETIGTNRYCHMTYREKIPSDRDLVDIDLQEDVFALAYAARKDAVNTKIQEAVKKFDTKAKTACADTIKSCAMRSCGGGLGSVCYKLARNDSASAGNIHVNSDSTYKDIEAGCAAIVNADANCIYAATSGEDEGYVYTYYDGEGTTFNKLFPTYDATNTSDPIGAVGKLNSILATSYNDAAIEQMKKQCQTTVLSCVRSMCGKDYINCYRNRTDVVSGSYDTDSSRFDRSMNKMGGVLDYNIVQGLCMSTVKNSPVCEEHLKVATAEWRNQEYVDNTSWGNASSVRESWLDSASTLKVKSYGGTEGDVIVACRPSQVTESGKPNILNNACDAVYDSVEPDNGQCGGYVDENGCVYDTPVYMSESEYVLENGAKTLFQTLLRDEELKAQNIYNAKLTKEQNICRNNNNGGVMGNMDNGSTFMWVKLRGNKVPKNYVTQGLTDKQFVASNDLYGSFCRARVTILSDDKDIQDLLNKYQGSAVAYFAVGDSFTCGSWLSNKTLQQISEKVGEREVCKQGYGKWLNGGCDWTGAGTESVKEQIAYSWATIGGALGGMGIGLGLSESGLLKKAATKTTENKSGASECSTYAKSAITSANRAKELDRDETKDSSVDKSDALRSLSRAISICKTLDLGCTSVNEDLEPDDIINKAMIVQETCDRALAKDINKSAKATNVSVPIVTSLAGAALGGGITASVIKQKKENIQNEAAQKWMDEVGEHIQCFVGTDELGTYGDSVAIEID